MTVHQPYDLVRHNSHSHHFGVGGLALLLEAFAPIPDQSYFLKPLVAGDNYHTIEEDTVNSEKDMAHVADNHTPLAAHDVDLGVPIVADQLAHVVETPADRQREETALQTTINILQSRELMPDTSLQ